MRTASRFSNPPPTLGEVRERMDWWREEARTLRRDRLSRLIQAGHMMDQLLDAIESDHEEREALANSTT
jgi:hypothetical protein